MKLLKSTLLAVLILFSVQSIAQDKETEIQTLLEKANTLIDAGKKVQAKTVVEKAYEINNKNIEVLALKGFLHYELDEYQNAINTYDQLLKLDDKNAEGFYYRGMAYTDLQDMKKACEDFTKAKELGYKLARLQYQQFCM